ncbi:uncharacterized protein LOC135167094 [Diachasmimorpha longicaudata]|uniref:uncharacterized protein LOC135167094 n=1 Tax=Diachasmimorpha longicaudata TaxID=58733 RepID=UPI0030B8A3DA
MSQYSSISESPSENSSFSSTSSSSSSSGDSEMYPDLRLDPDFVGLVPYFSRKENTFIYDISIELTITTNKNQASFARDCVRTVLLVILGRVFHEHEEWKQIGIYLMEILEERMNESGSWTTERRNHYVYKGNIEISGHYNQLKDLPEDLPVIYENIESNFPMLTGGKSKTNQRVVYRASFFLSPGINSAFNFYKDHGFAYCVPKYPGVEGQETQRCFKLYLKNIMKHQRRGVDVTYDDQLAWGTVYDAMKEVREDPNYEFSGDESPDGFYNTRCRRSY